MDEVNGMDKIHINRSRVITIKVRNDLAYKPPLQLKQHQTGEPKQRQLCSKHLTKARAKRDFPMASNSPHYPFSCNAVKAITQLGALVRDKQGRALPSFHFNLIAGPAKTKKERIETRVKNSTALKRICVKGDPFSGDYSTQSLQLSCLCSLVAVGRPTT